MSKYKLKLYIVENTSSSNELVEKLTVLFNNALNDDYKLQVIDIVKNPELAVSDNIIATPTLILEAPVPERRIMGNVGDEKSILIGLNLIR